MEHPAGLVEDLPVAPLGRFLRPAEVFLQVLEYNDVGPQLLGEGGDPVRRLACDVLADAEDLRADVAEGGVSPGCGPDASSSVPEVLQAVFLTRKADEPSCDDSAVREHRRAHGIISDSEVDPDNHFHFLRKRRTLPSQDVGERPVPEVPDQGRGCHLPAVMHLLRDVVDVRAPEGDPVVCPVPAVPQLDGERAVRIRDVHVVPVERRGDVRVVPEVWCLPLLRAHAIAHSQPAYLIVSDGVRHERRNVANRPCGGVPSQVAWEVREQPVEVPVDCGPVPCAMDQSLDHCPSFVLSGAFDLVPVRYADAHDEAERTLVELLRLPDAACRIVVYVLCMHDVPDGILSHGCRLLPSIYSLYLIIGLLSTFHGLSYI